MANSFEDRIKYLANDIRAQANDLRFDNFLSFIYTAEIVNKYVDSVLRKHGAKRTWMSILHILITHGGTMTPTELSGRALRSKHAITRATDSLEQRGLVRREGIGEDRRVRKVAITAKGLDVVKKTMADRRELGLRAMSCLGKEETQTFSATLKRLRKHMLSLIENSSSYR